MKLIRWLLHRPTWQKLPPIPRQLSTLYDDKQVDYGTARLMERTHTRCPQYVPLLLRRYHVDSADELIHLLPERRRPRRLRKKLLGLLRRWFGLTASDPMRKIAYQYKLKHTYRRQP